MKNENIVFHFSSVTLMLIVSFILMGNVTEGFRHLRLIPDIPGHTEQTFSEQTSQNRTSC